MTSLYDRINVHNILWHTIQLGTESRRNRSNPLEWIYRSMSSVWCRPLHFRQLWFRQHWLISNRNKMIRMHMNKFALKSRAYCGRTWSGITIINSFLSLSAKMCLMNVHPVPIKTIVMKRTAPFNLFTSNIIRLLVNCQFIEKSCRFITYKCVT